MKEVRAYKCNYCSKIYENRLTCISYEYRCYYNTNQGLVSHVHFLNRILMLILLEL